MREILLNGYFRIQAVKKAIPRFEYFKADTPLSESDTAIQNFFRKLAHETIKEYGTESLEEFISHTLTEVLSKITDKINKVVPDDEKVEPEVN
jgi:hypothetical protein